MRRVVIITLLLCMGIGSSWGFCPETLGDHGTGNLTSTQIFPSNANFSNATYNNGIDSNGRSTGVMETLVVIDKELGEKFGQDMDKILDYLTVYFWDVNLRLKTIDGVKLSIQIISVHLITDSRDQTFIESSRNPTNNFTDFRKVVNEFNLWLHSQDNPFPIFDIAILLTKAEDFQGILGVAPEIGVACKKFNSGVVVHDNGFWSNVTIGTHEIGHIIGAHHDSVCGFDNLMAPGWKNTFKKRWYFSSCSSGEIGEYVRSDYASCIRRKDNHGNLPIDPSFSSVRAPSMAQQCKILTGNSFAYVTEADTKNCTALKCSLPNNNGKKEFKSDLDNILCHRNGRCFRGKCRQPGTLIMNAFSGKCISTLNKFQREAAVEFVSCPRSSAGTPLDRFLIIDGKVGKMLSTPYQLLGGEEISGESCITYERNKGRELRTTPCNFEDKQQRWDIIRLGNGQVMLRHRQTKKCAKQMKSRVKLYPCLTFISKMRWNLL